MRLLQSAADLDAFREQFPEELGLVPTMGNLHAGHLSLVRLAQAECKRVVVSIYVNPTQFSDPADLARYPRTWDSDRTILTQLDVDAVFAPDDALMYPKGLRLTHGAGPLADRWEGAYRSGHFEGVCTAVARLFELVQPDLAYFGEKDYQQLQVISGLVQDDKLSIRIRAGATVREANGLALSSRNSLIKPADRAKAPLIYETLIFARDQLRASKPPDQVLNEAIQMLLDAGFTVDYLALVNSESLEPLSKYEAPAHLLIAVHLGEVRLIDNCAV